MPSATGIDHARCAHKKTEVDSSCYHGNAGRFKSINPLPNELVATSAKLAVIVAAGTISNAWAAAVKMAPCRNANE
jgi:hypothetical protein